MDPTSFQNYASKAPGLKYCGPPIGMELKMLKRSWIAAHWIAALATTLNQPRSQCVFSLGDEPLCLPSQCY